jgi:cytochrome b
MALKPRDAGLKLPMPVWDLPTRLFHWALPVLLIVSYVSHARGLIGPHRLAGYAMAALLLFRLAWGFVGSDTARFGRFLRGPGAVLGQIRSLFRREPDTAAGHTPAGGWIGLLLLLLLAAQVITGFCAEGAGGAGPLAARLGADLAARMRDYHGLIFKLILAVVAVHLLLVAAHALFKGQDLTRAMVTGRKRLPAATRAPGMVRPLAALVLLAIAAGIVFAVVRLA